MRRIGLIFIAIALSLPLRASASIGTITDSGSFTSQSQSRFLPLYYETQCSVTISGSATNFSILAESSGDGGRTFVPVVGINGGAPITSNGTYTGTVPVLPSAQTNGFTLLQKSTLIQGSANYSITCTASNADRSGSATLVPADGGTQAVTFSTAFATSVSSVVLTVSNYSGTDNAAISCRVSGSPTTTGFTVTCAGGQTGSTVTVYYESSGT